MSETKEVSLRKCGDWECCVAYDSNDEECSRNNGCMTEENIASYLEWCKRAFEQIEKDFGEGKDE